MQTPATEAAPYLILDSGGERCHLGCGRRYDLVWMAPDDLWEEFAGGPGGTACPDCFSAWALKEKGLLVRFEAVVAIDAAVGSSRGSGVTSPRKDGQTIVMLSREGMQAWVERHTPAQVAARLILLDEALGDTLDECEEVNQRVSQLEAELRFFRRGWGQA